MSLTIRAVTGTVVLPSGTNVTSGEVIFKLYGTPPADSEPLTGTEGQRRGDWLHVSVLRQKFFKQR